MVAPEPGEPLLRYITMTADAISMVLVAERPEPSPPLDPKGAVASGLGSQDLEPKEEAREGDAVGSHEPKATPAPEPQAGSQPPEAITGPDDQEAAGSQLPEAFSGPGGNKSLEPDPMEVDVSDSTGRVRTIQCLVYYISEFLHDAKMRYLEVKKLLYAVLIASKKLHHYFQAHKISVVTSYPLRVVLHSPKATDNITMWAAELAKFELDFIMRHAVKRQVLADFIAEWTPPTCPLGVPDDCAPEPWALVFTRPHWTLFFDSSSCK
jgi:hypothetical protein